MAFSEVTSTNHAGVIWIISLLGMVYSMLTFITRGFIKWHMLGPDDFALVAAQIFAFGQYGALFSSLQHGLGKETEMLTMPSRSTLSRSALTSQILLIISLGLSKCSVIFLIRRVFSRDMKHFWLICNIFLGAVTVWTIGSVIIVSAGCDASKYIPPNGNETCGGLNPRWNIVVAIDAITEIIMVVLPIYFLWTLQMAVDLKARVVLAFAFRLPVAIFAIIFMYLFTTLPKNSDRGVPVAVAIVWQQIQLSYSLISATIPCLKSFIRSFDTNFGMGDGSSEGQYNYSSGHTHSGSGSHTRSAVDYHAEPGTNPTKQPQETIKMHPLRPRRSAAFRRDSEKPKEVRSKPHIGKLRPEKLKTSTTIYADKTEERDRPESRGSASSQAGSQELIIRRDVQFDVRSDYAPGSITK